MTYIFFIIWLPLPPHLTHSLTETQYSQIQYFLWFDWLIDCQDCQDFLQAKVRINITSHSSHSQTNTHSLHLTDSFHSLSHSSCREIFYVPSLRFTFLSFHRLFLFFYFHDFRSEINQLITLIGLFISLHYLFIDFFIFYSPLVTFYYYFDFLWFDFFINTQTLDTHVTQQHRLVSTCQTFSSITNNFFLSLCRNFWSLRWCSQTSKCKLHTFTVTQPARVTPLLRDGDQSTRRDGYLGRRYYAESYDRDHSSDESTQFTQRTGGSSNATPHKWYLFFLTLCDLWRWSGRSDRYAHRQLSSQ